MIVTLPLLMLLLDYWPLGRFSATKTVGVALSQSASIGTFPRPSGNIKKSLLTFLKLGLEKIPFMALVAGSSWVTVKAVKRIESFLYDASAPTIPHRIEIALASHGDYIRTLFFPKGLTFFYWQPGPSMDPILVFFSVFVIIAMTAISFITLKRKPYIFMGWFWFLITLIPVTGWVHISTAWKADRYTYFA